MLLAEAEVEPEVAEVEPEVVERVVLTLVKVEEEVTLNRR